VDRTNATLHMEDIGGQRGEFQAWPDCVCAPAGLSLFSTEERNRPSRRLQLQPSERRAHLAAARDMAIASAVRDAQSSRRLKRATATAIIAVRLGLGRAHVVAVFTRAAHWSLKTTRPLPDRRGFSKTWLPRTARRRPAALPQGIDHRHVVPRRSAGLGCVPATQRTRQLGVRAHNIQSFGRVPVSNSLFAGAGL
jgi:hypothetical protein